MDKDRQIALGWARKHYEQASDAEKGHWEFIFPGLKESEDERVRKFLVQHISEWIGCIEHDLTISSKDIESEKELAMFKDALAYLEKQKEQKPTELPKSEDYGIDGLYAAVDILQITLGKVDGYQTDDGILAHKCAISAVKELYEQKPAEYLDKDKVYTIITKLTKLSCSQLIPISSDEFKKLYEITSDVRDLLGHSAQKPIDEVDENVELTPFESALFSAFSDAWQKYMLGETVNVAHWAKEHSEELLEVIKEDSAKWSEKDTEIKGNLRHILNAYAFEHSGLDVNGDYIEQNYIDADNWLKHLPERFNLQPNQGWSEEDEVNLGDIKCALYDYYGEERAEELYNMLKSLRPIKQEWSEEDEKFFRLLHAGLYAMKVKIGRDEFDKAVNKLKSLRPQPQGVYQRALSSIQNMITDYMSKGPMTAGRLQDLVNNTRVKCKDAVECAAIVGEGVNWKPSEEQMDILDKVYHYLWADRNATADMQDGLGDFIDELKSL